MPLFNLKTGNLGLVLLLALALTTIPWLGSKEFYTRGEPREALVAQAMLKSGNWILPRVYNEEIPSKPPLLHWLIALSSMPTGQVTEFSARLPSALAAVLFVFYLFHFLAKRIDQGQALLTCVILWSTGGWFRSTVTCRVDTILAVFIGLALLTLYEWAEHQLIGLPWKPILALSGAFLVKGPVGLVLPVGIFAVELARTRVEAHRTIKSVLLVTIPALIIPAAWYLLAYRIGGDAFLDKVYYENIARFTGTQADRPHAHSIFYLYGTVLLGLLPWSYLYAVWAKQKLLPWRSIKPGSVKVWFYELPRIFQYALITILSFLIFYSIPASKRSDYLLPIYPFLAIFLTAMFCKVHQINPRGITRLSLSLILLLTALNGLILPYFANQVSPKAFSSEIKGVAGQQALYSFKDAFYGISFYTDKEIKQLQSGVVSGSYVIAYEVNQEMLTKEFPQHTFTRVLTSSSAVVKRGQRVALYQVM